MAGKAKGKETLDKLLRLVDERVKKLLEVCSPQERTDLLVLVQAVVKNLQEFRKENTAEKLKHWKASKAALNESVEQLWRKYFPDEISFKNIQEVVSYLQQQGWKVSDSTVYNHKRDGLISPNAQGRYLQKTVDKYAAQNLERLDGGRQDPGGDEDLQKQIKDAELRKVNAQANKIEFENDIRRGRYIDKTIVEQDRAARAVLFKSDLRNFFRREVHNIVELCGGNPELTPKLLTFFDRQVDVIIGRYSEDREFVVCMAEDKTPEQTTEEEDE